jgi:hypothetical protein
MITTLALATLALSPISSDWYTRAGDDHWYTLTSRSLSWPDAEAQAQAQGGHLATISDAEENSWAYAQFGGRQEVWIGLTDAGSRGVWAWSSGEVFDFHSWAPGEPNNLFGIEDFAVFSTTTEAAWRDIITTATRYGIIEVVSMDCDGNLIPDSVELLDGTGTDCDANGILDICDPDCDGDSVPDACRQDTSDCNANGVPDSCDLSNGDSLDCNKNMVPDECDIASEFDPDCDENGVPDSCDPDCNENGVPDACDILAGTPDCNRNQLPDECDIASGYSSDLDSDGVPDECQPDCNRNGVPDGQDIGSGGSIDCDRNGIPDECENDCDGNGVGDLCDIASRTHEDCNANSIPDVCDVLDRAYDQNGNGLVDTCECPSSAYCTASPNSAGRGALLTLTELPSYRLGSGGVAVSGLPVNAPVVFFYGSEAASAPFGAGIRCVSHPIKRLHPVQIANRAGTASLAFDYLQPPLFGESPGDVRYFQAWYIDSGRGRTANMSNAIQLTLCP